MKLIEAYGTGISKIFSCYKGMPVQPKFENVEGAFRVILPNTHAHEMRVEDEKVFNRYSDCLKNKKKSLVVMLKKPSGSEQLTQLICSKRCWKKSLSKKLVTVN